MTTTGVVRVAAGSLVAVFVACGSESDPPASSSDDAGSRLGAGDAAATSNVAADGAADAGAVAKSPSPDAASAPSSEVHGPYPIVLLHGMGGFDHLENLPVDVSYFNGVASDLAAQGERMVFVTVAPPFDTSERRAAALTSQIDAVLQQTGAAKLNLIGHSQGGLDARVLASPAGLGFGDRIASVTTVSTPHRGTLVADAALGLIPGGLSAVASAASSGFLALLEAGVYPTNSTPGLSAQEREMTTSYMSDVFNPQFVDDVRVVYESYAGRTALADGSDVCVPSVVPNQPSARDIAQPALGATATFLTAAGETSDGLVPVSSARWGTFIGCVPADHLKEVGMVFQNGVDPVSGFDHLAFFRRVVARIRNRGF